jgi:DNA recombination-dependent growth factor C
MFPAIFMLVLVGGFGVFKYVMLYRANQNLRIENSKLQDELFEFKYVPRATSK